MPEGPDVRCSHDDVIAVLKGCALTGFVIPGCRFQKKVPVGSRYKFLV